MTPVLCQNLDVSLEYRGAKDKQKSFLMSQNNQACNLFDSMLVNGEFLYGNFRRKGRERKMCKVLIIINGLNICTCRERCAFQMCYWHKGLVNLGVFCAKRRLEIYTIKNYPAITFFSLFFQCRSKSYAILIRTLVAMETNLKYIEKSSYI